VKPRRFLSGLITATIIALAAAAWLFLAPTRIGGSTTYVITSGVSMEPRFHTGDLAIVQEAAHYRVGMVVAYHSSLLKEVVLHRIVAIHDGRYTFKGDNNNFLDPVHPTRSQLIGALWIRVAHGGRILHAVHSPVTVILLGVFVGLLITGGTGKRRRDRRRGSRPRRPSQPEPVNRLRDNTSLAPSLRSLLIGFGAGGAAFVVLAAFAFHHPTTTSARHTIPYTQRARFSYHAAAPRGAVYPDGVVSTGDPIFLQLVRRMSIKVAYTFDADAARQVTGTQRLVLNLNGPSGWSRSIPLTPVRHFTGVNGTIAATLDVGAVQSLLAQVQKQTGLPSGYGYTLAISLNAHVHGTLEGQPVDKSFSPSMIFNLQPLELAPATASSPPATGSPATGGAASSGPNQKQGGSVATSASVANPIRVLGHSISAATLAWVGLVGFVICALTTIPLAILLKRNKAFDEAARIRARYAHLLVPILIGDDLGWPPVDVTSFKALVRLAESAGQLILHHQADAVDTYLVNDNGTVYRYQITLPLVSWGEWTETNVAADPAALADAATVLAEAAAPANEAAPTAG
jgi:signal peptidase I